MKREYWAAAFTVASIGLSGGALAQTPAASGELTLEEVVVTAERREENLQKVAATVTAISTERLQEEGVRDITDLQRVAPQLVIQQGVFNNISQRGISTGSYSPVSEGTTAVHLDGAYISRFTGLNGITFDTQRVEIVDGPQGTLYGRNATAGTINFITNRPGDEFGGNGSLEIGSYRQISAQFAVNLPISETLKTRVAFYHTSGDGFYSNGEADSLTTSARVSAMWKPTENDQLVVSFTGVRIGGHGGGGGNVIDRWVKKPTLVQVTGAPATGTTTIAPGTVWFPIPTTVGGSIACPTSTTSAPVPCNLIPFEPAMQTDPWDNKPGSGWDSRGNVNTRNNALIAQYEHRFNFATLSASASMQGTSTANIGGMATGYEGSNVSPQLNQMLWTAGWRRPGGPTFQTFTSDWESYELHLSSNQPGQFTWIGGVYHFHEAGRDNKGPNVGIATCIPYTLNSACNPAANSNPLYTYPGAYAYGQTLIQRDVGLNPVYSAIVNNWTTTSADAIFGQATWTPTFLSRAHLTAGARYNSEARAGNGWNLTNGVIVPRFFWDTGGEWHRTTYKANLSFDITDRNMVYVDRSTGFKSGGVGYGPTPLYDPENLQAWEFGSKNRFFNDKLQVNLAYWYYNFSNRQVNGADYYYDYTDVLPEGGGDNDPLGSATVGALVNAGRVLSKGQSIDLTWLVTTNDRIRLSAQHVDSRYVGYDLRPRQTALNAYTWCTATADGSTPTGGCPVGVGDDYYNPTPYDPLAPPTLNQDNRRARLLNLVPQAAGAVLTGTRANNTRPWSGNFSYTHTFRLASASLETTLSAQYSGSVDGVGAVGTNGNLIMAPSYHSHDLNLRYRPDDANWDLLFYARNFDNREYKTDIGFTSNAASVASSPLPIANYLDPRSVSLANYAYWTATYGAPRTYGVTLSARF